MKFPSIQVLLLLAACATGCADSTPVASSVEATYYGSVIETAGALSAAEVREALEANGRAEVVMAGEITATCPKKGCWMEVASGEDTVFVRFFGLRLLCAHRRGGRQANGHEGRSVF